MGIFFLVEFLNQILLGENFLENWVAIIYKT